MAARITILLLALFGLALFVFPQSPAKKELKPPLSPDTRGSLVYRDGSISAFLQKNTITIVSGSTGAASIVTLPPPCRQKTPVSGQDTGASAQRAGDLLKLTASGTVYSIRLGSDAPWLDSAYPDPGCSGDKIIIDKSKNILYLYKQGDLSNTYRVSTGKKPEFTPEGNFSIMNRVYIPPGSGKNRFGPRWLGIGVPCQNDLRSEKPDPRAPRGIKYGIHGTDEPWSIGAYASGGCIRLSNKDIIDLFERVKVGTPVEIIK